MRTCFALVFVSSFFTYAHSIPLIPILSITGIATATISQGIAYLIVRNVIKNTDGKSAVNLVKDPGTLLANPNCTTTISSDNPENTPVGCKVSTRTHSSALSQKHDGAGRLDSRHTPDIVRLEPGQTFEHEFNLGDYFNLTQLPPGSYQLHLYNHARYEDDNGFHNYEIPKASTLLSFTWPPSGCNGSTAL